MKHLLFAACLICLSHPAEAQTLLRQKLEIVLHQYLAEAGPDMKLLVKDTHGELRILTSDDIRFHSQIFLLPKKLEGRGVLEVSYTESNNTGIVSVKGIEISKENLITNKVIKRDSVLVTAGSAIEEIKDKLADALYSVGKTLFFNKMLWFN